MLPSFPPGYCRFIDSQPFRHLLLRQSVNPPIFSNFFPQVLVVFLERITAQELDNLGNLGQGRFDPVLLPKVNREVRNIKLDGKLALG